MSKSVIDLFVVCFPLVLGRVGWVDGSGGKGGGCGGCGGLLLGR